MRLRPLWMTGLVCLGCQSITGSDQREPLPPTPPAQQLWQAGQEAMKAGQPQQAIAMYEKSLHEDRKLTQNHLSLAAAYLEAGDDEQACTHLGLFLTAHPEHRNARFYHAELLRKLGRHAAARGEYDHAIRTEQEEAEPDLKHLVHCHTRVLEIGSELGDDYLVQLHRGIGLVLLARQCAALGEPETAPSSEAILCKAVAALSRARALRPGEARPSWYLHLAWHGLGQPQPARRCLADACRHAAFSELTSAEYRELMLTADRRLDPREHAK
jgi:tetratricopeptide (TPR) repeat protein